MWGHDPTGTRYVRVEDVEHRVEDVGDEVDVALAPASARVHAEGLLGGEAQEQQLGVVDVELVGGLPLARALLQVRVVPGGGEEEGYINPLYRNGGRVALTSLPTQFV